MSESEEIEKYRRGVEDRRRRLDAILEAGDKQALLDFIAESEAGNEQQVLHSD